MSITVTAGTFSVNFAPETTVEEILQNVAVILSTPQYSVPLDRGFGLEQKFLDKPMEVAKSMMVDDVITAIEGYEPRAKVLSVGFEEGIEGYLSPSVEVEIDE